MHKHLRAAVAASFIVAALSPLSAGASTMIFGTGFAHDCSLRALSGEHDVESLGVCTSALQQDVMSKEDYAKTMVNRGVIMMRRAGVEPAGLKSAKQDFDKAQTITPELAEIYVNRAVILLKQRQYSEAVSQLDRGIALNPDEIEKAYYDRAIAKEGVGDVQGAYNDYKKASELLPTWDAPRKELGRFNVTRAPT